VPTATADGFTARQAHAALLLSRGTGPERVARRVGADPRTLDRWLRSERFRELVEERRRSG
jgi:hypothetical protein